MSRRCGFCVPVLPALLAALGLLTPPPLSAQAPVLIIGEVNGGTSVTIEDGTYTEPASYFTGALVVDINGVFNLDGEPWPTNSVEELGLWFGTQWTGGQNGTSVAAPGQDGGNSGFLTVTNSADVNIQIKEVLYEEIMANMFLLYLTAIGANGGAGDADNPAGGSGGVPAGGVSVVNTGNFSFSEMQAYTTGYSVFGITVTTLGGNGAAGYTATDPVGAGGDAQAGDNGTSVTNSGHINFGTLAAAGGVYGLNVRSNGGQTGPVGEFTSARTAAGGSGGDITINQSGTITGSIGTIYSEFYGIFTESLGRDSAGSGENNVDGADGGSGGSITLNLTEGADINLSIGLQNGISVTPGSILYAVSQGGTGGNAFENGTAGAGGNAGGSSGVAITATNVQFNVTTIGGPLVVAEALAGDGGTGYDSNTGTSSGGDGGNASNVSINLNFTDGSVLNANQNSSAVQARSIGGRGGEGSPTIASESAGGNGGQGGSAGTVGIGLAGTASISTSLNEVPAVTAISQGGKAGMGGFHHGIGGGPGGQGGHGGNAGEVIMSLSNQIQISTTGNTSVGFFGQSAAGNGADSGETETLWDQPHAGGNGGNSGVVELSVGLFSSIATTGENSHAIVAQSLSGYGGKGGVNKDPFGGGSGPGGNGGVAGSMVDSVLTAATVWNEGTLTTAGANAIAILAQGVSGAGGAGGSSNAFFFADPSSGGNSGQVGNIVVTNRGNITTGPAVFPGLAPSGQLYAGQGSYGILAQSVAGGGGAAGSSTEALVSLGGDGSTNSLLAAGGQVNVINSGNITTGGQGAIALLAQSVGGGGGDGGTSSSLALSIGGSGGAGGNGGRVIVQQSDGTVQTLGIQAHGIVAQSLGGGGGNAGSATTAGIVGGVSLGGNTTGSKDSQGGDGGETAISLVGTTINTGNSNSAAVLAQSIGGGGGTGGASASYSESIGLGGGVSLGGGGGTGGNGGPVAIEAAGVTINAGFSPDIINAPETPVNTLPVDAFGIVAQSIGGGGGTGGSALNQNITLAIPVAPEVAISGSFNYVAGGSGGGGGSSVGLHSTSPAALLNLSNGSQVTTAGQGSHALVAQSIGGGGGNGGDSSSTSATLSYGRAASASGTTMISPTINITQGGAGAQGGSGGVVTVQVERGDFFPQANHITTLGDFANAIVAQSIGGGGGNAGFGSSTTQSWGAGVDITVQASLGATGGAGGTGGAVNINIDEGNEVETYGSGAIGVVAQSIGGGGGTSQGGSFTFGGDYTFGENGTFQPGAALQVDLGATGGAGGSGDDVAVQISSPITTRGGDATGILAQSIGGGGGLFGSAGSDASADNPIRAYGIRVRTYLTNVFTANLPLSATFKINGSSTDGAAGDGGNVTVDFNSTLRTHGDWAQGIVAQSIGGSGGKSGSASSYLVSQASDLTFNLGTMTNNEPSPDGNNGSQVTLNLEATTITTGLVTEDFTTGYGAFGVLLQSIGGGGGVLVDGSNSATGTMSVGGTADGVGGGSGGGGNITINAQGSGLSHITTHGDVAHAIVMQSIGGGGGLTASGSSRPSTAPETGVNINVGGGGAAYGNAGNIDFTGVPLQIETVGASAFGLLAQSIGGGGGAAFARYDGTTQLGGNIPVITGLGLQDGGTVALDVTSVSSITTAGLGAHGIVAQSIGGGGGIINNVWEADAVIDPYIQKPAVTYGSANTVTISVDGAVATTGASAYGILAQSIGAGGGFIGSGNTLFAGSTGQTGNPDVYSIGIGNNIAITVGGSVSATGSGSVGIFAQTAGLPENDNPNEWATTITINGSVLGGGGTNGTGVFVAGASNIDNALTLGNGATLSAASGVAVRYSGDRVLNVTNNGTISGSLLLNSSDNPNATFTNNGRWNAGTQLFGNIVDNGVTAVGVGIPGGSGTTTISGNYTQNSNATLELNVLAFDLSTNTATYDFLSIEGNGQFNGHVNVWFPGGFNFVEGASFRLINAPGGSDSYYTFQTVAFQGLPTGVTATWLSAGDEEGLGFVTTIVAIPEPSSALLLLGGLGWLLRRRWRKR